MMLHTIEGKKQILRTNWAQGLRQNLAETALFKSEISPRATKREKTAPSSKQLRLTCLSLSDKKHK